MRFDWLDHRQHSVNEDADLIEIKPGSEPVFDELAPGVPMPVELQRN
jgi:hypothetical protein